MLLEYHYYNDEIVLTVMKYKKLVRGVDIPPIAPRGCAFNQLFSPASQFNGFLK